MAGRAAALRLFGTPTSPYARIARIAVAELQLESEVELVWTATRQPNDPSLAFNPSGRVSSAAAPTTATAGYRLDWS